MTVLSLVGVAGIAFLLTLFLFRIPVAVAMIVTALVGHAVLSFLLPHFYLLAHLKQYKVLIWSLFSNYPLSALPLFILMGSLASQSGVSKDILNGFILLFGRFRSGLAMATILSCAGFGAISGSSLATAATMSKIALPTLRQLQYPPHFATGLLAAGGTLGVLIPPSIVLVLYAIVVEASIIELFQAAIIPGFMAVGFFVMVCIFWAKRLSLSHKNHSSVLPERTAVIKSFVPPMMVFSLIIFGLAFGIFTPTPAAAVGVFCVLTLGLLRGDQHRLNTKAIAVAITDCAKTTGLIALILFGAETLKSFFTRTGLPQAFADWAVHTPYFTPIVILMLILLMLVFLGCALESLTLILIVVPFFWPALVAMNGGPYVLAGDATFGMDSYDLKLWFGILALIVVELGLITPPLGLNVYVIHATAKDIPLATIFKGSMPFFGVEIIRIAILILFPVFTLAIPRLLL